MYILLRIRHERFHLELGLGYTKQRAMTNNFFLLRLQPETSHHVTFQRKDKKDSRVYLDLSHERFPQVPWKPVALSEIVLQPVLLLSFLPQISLPFPRGLGQDWKLVLPSCASR